MNELMEFTKRDIKPIRWFFNILWLILLGITAILVLFVWQKDPIFVSPQSDYIKTVVTILLLATIPAIFGWYTMKVRKLKPLEDKHEKLKKYEKVWKIRALVVLIVFILVMIAYILVLEKSMAFMVAIAAFVFMYCRPSENTLRNELNDIPKF